MNQSQNTQAAISQNLKAEAEERLQKHCDTCHLEAAMEAKLALDAYETSLLRGASYRPPVDLPWVVAMMGAAVMPDGQVCKQTIRNHVVSHSEMMTIHTGGRHEYSLELRKEMEAMGCIWGYHDIANSEEGEEQYYYAEVTGYGLAKFLGINLNTYMADQRAARQKTV